MPMMLAEAPDMMPTWPYAIWSKGMGVKKGRHEYGSTKDEKKHCCAAVE